MAIIKNKKITNVGKDVEKLEPLYIVHMDVKQCSCSGKWYGGSSKTIKMELSYDQPILFLVIYVKKKIDQYLKEKISALPC
jgi:hypothetical protein